MENSKTLSSQRYTEDHDLLKRSMRKSKHGDGNPESSAIEIAGGSGTIDEKGSQEMGSVDVVAETLMEEQATLDLEASRTATTAICLILALHPLGRNSTLRLHDPTWIRLSVTVLGLPPS
nr:hypothetical protein Iba_chr07bCG8360 [Ipomoea batatas]